MQYGTALPSEFEIGGFWLKKDLGSKNPFEHVRIGDGDVVMDVGAYSGTFTAAALEQGASKVYCFEPAPKNIARLLANVARYGDRVVVEQVAIGATTGTTKLVLSGWDGAHTIAPRESVEGKKALVVNVAAFRDRLRSIRPAVLKIDIEGAEYGAFATLQPDDLASVNSLFIEFHPFDDRDAKITAIREYVRREGFEELSTRRRAYVANRVDRCLGTDRWDAVRQAYVPFSPDPPEFTLVG